MRNRDDRAACEKADAADYLCGIARAVEFDIRGIPEPCPLRFEHLEFIE